MLSEDGRVLGFGGGNASELLCAGLNNPGAETLMNLTEELRDCSSEISDACSDVRLDPSTVQYIETCLSQG